MGLTYPTARRSLSGTHPTATTAMDDLINLQARIRGFDEPLAVRLADDGEVVLGRVRKGQFLADAYFSREKAIELRDKLTALLGPS